MTLDYESSGVNLRAADEALNRIKSLVASTRTPGVIGDVGLFAGALRLPLGEKAHPVLLASTDGVGTKLKIALLAKRYDTVGEDLVNHCVNDLLANGGEPLFFLDYFACGRLKPDVLEGVVAGLVRGCRNNGIALLGGETAEMPGFYSEDEFDLAGTIVGWADESELILGREIHAGDVILGIAAKGLHTNGYSLVRKALLEMAGLKLDQYIPELNCTLAEELLKVHPSYLPTVRRLRSQVKIKGMAHITGGGIEGNLIRVVPNERQINIRYGSWLEPPIFDLIRRQGPVAEDEMRRVFNLGVGMALVVSREEAGKLTGEDLGSERLFEIGEIA